MSQPSWAISDEPKPAPGPLLLVQSFVNTLDQGAGTDLLDDPAAGGRWLREAGLAGPAEPVGTGELRLARNLREGIRALLIASGRGQPPQSGALGPLREMAAGVAPRLTVTPAGRVELTPEPGGQLAGGLLGLLIVIRDAQHEGTWPRLKACANDGCQWAFYDRSHSRRGIWCDMAACGNVIKNRNLRARRTGRPVRQLPDRG